MGTGIDMNRGTDHVVLNKETSPEIFHKLEDESAIMRLGRRIVLPGAGIDFQTITADPTANWVGETAQKPVSTPTLGEKTMKGYTVAVILPVSRQLARDKKSLVAEMVRSLPSALGKKFDLSCLGIDSVPGTGFDQFDSTVKKSSIATSTYDGLVNAESNIGEAGYIANKYLFAPQAKRKLLLAKDGNQRPLFIDHVRTEGEGSLGHVLGTPTYFNKHVYKAGAESSSTPAQLGIVGDWNKALYGIVESIEIRMLDQAAITINNQLISLPEHNMVAYRAEMEVGFMIVDKDAFCVLTGDVPTNANDEDEAEDKKAA